MNDDHFENEKSPAETEACLLGFFLAIQHMHNIIQVSPKYKAIQYLKDWYRNVEEVSKDSQMWIQATKNPLAGSIMNEMVDV